jgi:hypothetical protein
VPIVLKSGSLNRLESSGPIKAYNGIALPLHIVATVISRESLNQCWREMAVSPTERSWCVLEFARSITVLWLFNARSDDNLDVVVHLRRWTEGGMNSFLTEDASVIKERVARGGQVLPKRRSTECVKLSLAAPGNLCRDPVEC